MLQLIRFDSPDMDAIAEALAEMQGFLLVGGLAKMVGKVPRKFGERRRGVLEDLKL